MHVRLNEREMIVDGKRLKVDRNVKSERVKARDEK